jgi:diguanylate cyclase (GGDEF)-like protein
VRFEVEHALCLDAALGSLEHRRFDAMLLDLSLPDGGGISTLGLGCSLANHLPVLVMTSTDDERMAMAALRAGAQEYLVKDRIDYRALPVTILRAIERHRRVSRALGMARRRSATRGPVPLRDSVTGLVSEPVLWDRLEHAIDRAARRGGPLAVVTLRYDALVEMRGLLGPDLADRLMCEAAQRIQALVRRSDTFARYGSNGFVLVLEDAGSEADTERIVGVLLDAAAQVRVGHPGGELSGLEPRVGRSAYPDHGASPEALLAAAESSGLRSLSG